MDEDTAIALATTAYAVLSAQIARHGVGRALAVAGRLPPWSRTTCDLVLAGTIVAWPGDESRGQVTNRDQKTAIMGHSPVIDDATERGR